MLIDDLDIGIKEKNTNKKYESSITYHSKVMGNVNSFEEKHTDRTKTICPQSNEKQADITIEYSG